MKLITVAIAAILLAGCGEEKVDTAFLNECPAPVVCPDPIECSEEGVIYGSLRDDLIDQIDVSTVKLDHYVDEVMIASSFADIIEINGSLATSSEITLPPYPGSPVKHTLLVEFMQVK